MEYEVEADQPKQVVWPASAVDSGSFGVFRVFGLRVRKQEDEDYAQ